MEKKSYAVAIDLGSSKAAVAVGGYDEAGLLDIAALSERPVEGMRAGRIENIELVSRAVKEAVTEVEDELGIRITEAYAGISGEFVRCARHTDHVYVYDPQNGVCRRDVEALFDRMRNVQAPDDETIMERVPQNYVVDDCQEVKNPVGSFGKKLSSTFNFILCQQVPMQRLDMALRRLGIRMMAAFPDAIATSDAVLLPDEREEGVALVDLGAETTDVAVYYRNVLRYVATIPMGASAINNDIRSLSVPEKYVENLKCRYGSAVARLAPENKLIRVSGRTAKDAKDILLRNLATVIEARMTDIAEFVLEEIRDSGYATKLTCGIVLTGGGSRLKDVEVLFREVTGLDVRLATPETGLTEEALLRASTPAAATVTGLLMKGAQLAPCVVAEKPSMPAAPADEPARRPAAPAAPAAAAQAEPARPEFRHVPPRHPEAEAEASRPEPRRNDPQLGEVRAPQPAEEPAAVRPEVAAEPVRREPETSRGEDAAAETTHSKRDWGRIFKRAIEKINDGFNAAEDEEI